MPPPVEKQLEEEKTEHQKAFERAQELEQEISRLQAAAPAQPQFNLGSRPSTPTASPSNPPKIGFAAPRELGWARSRPSKRPSCKQSSACAPSVWFLASE